MKLNGLSKKIKVGAIMLAMVGMMCSGLNVLAASSDSSTNTLNGVTIKSTARVTAQKAVAGTSARTGITCKVSMSSYSINVETNQTYVVPLAASDNGGVSRTYYAGNGRVMYKLKSTHTVSYQGKTFTDKLTVTTN